KSAPPPPPVRSLFSCAPPSDQFRRGMGLSNPKNLAHKKGTIARHHRGKDAGRWRKDRPPGQLKPCPNLRRGLAAHHWQRPVVGGSCPRGRQSSRGKTC